MESVTINIFCRLCIVHFSSSVFLESPLQVVSWLTIDPAPCFKPHRWSSTVQSSSWTCLHSFAISSKSAWILSILDLNSCSKRWKSSVGFEGPILNQSRPETFVYFVFLFSKKFQFLFAEAESRLCIWVVSAKHRFDGILSQKKPKLITSVLFSRVFLAEV